MSERPLPLIHTEIWQEEPEPGNRFATRAAYCRGYDVYGEMVGNARWVEMLFLLFRPELPTPAALDLLEALAVGLANPGPRDPSVHAAMCGGIAGSNAAASLMAALGVGAGRYHGARDVHDAMLLWAQCGMDADAWKSGAANTPRSSADVWPQAEHPPGFEPHAKTAAGATCALLDALARIEGTPRLRWLQQQRRALEEALDMGLEMSGVAAAAFADLGFNPAEGEMLYLLLRLPGAAAHALEQQRKDYTQFPFYPVELEDDPARKEAT
ncbi:citryl-CoA lyase [Noviherbaspirillum saxi]|uniref:Citryl-CoA lyase n=1 Tax=Noviherbaspirillum saxi TaxID=2320863 RepID=A0A3A3FUL5_9BURK|nr:citryl-CoA lyase [Noviherbaspirillum saxi]